MKIVRTQTAQTSSSPSQGQCDFHQKQISHKPAFQCAQNYLLLLVGNDLKGKGRSSL